MNALHKLMADNPDPQVVQTVSQCLQALAKLQSTAFQQHQQNTSAAQNVMQQLQAGG
jgi:hypothetical protein